MSSLQIKLSLAVAIAGLAAGPLQAEPVAPVEVVAPLPTSVMVTVAGKPPAAVRREIRVAAHYVCRNAVAAGDLSILETYTCAEATNATAQARYRVILRGLDTSRTAANPAVMTIAMR